MNTTLPLSTKQAAAVLGVAVTALQSAIFRGRCPEPHRAEGSHRWLWLPEDIEAAREALAQGRQQQTYQTKIMSPAT